MTISGRSPSAGLDIFGAPLVIGIVTGGGLMSGLLGDGLWDILSWLALPVPLAVIGWAIVRPTRDPPQHEGQR